MMALSVYVLWFCLFTRVIRTGPVADLVIIAAISPTAAIGEDDIRG